MGIEPLRRWRPSDADPFDLAAAGHLLRRAGHGGALAARKALVLEGVDAAVDRVLAGELEGEDTDPTLRLALAFEDQDKLRAWRVWRLLRGRHQLRERMARFWHGHFATSIRKVGDVAAMARHFDVFDRLGLGTFDELALAVARDPAMIRWLDTDANVAGRPNENFARELFELFTLGRGAYGEADVREAARAFTGWSVRDGRFRLARHRHDRGEKEVLGVRGDFGGEEVVAIAVGRPEHARFLARKLLQELVHPEPGDDEVEALAAEYAAQGRRLDRTLGTLLRSELFFAPRARRSRIKDPLDFAVGAVRALGATASPARLGRSAAAMGLDVGDPPSVEGWPRERAWLSSATWLARANFAAELAQGGLGLAPAVEAICSGRAEPAAAARLGVELLLDGELAGASRRALDGFLGGFLGNGRPSPSAVFHAILCLPEAQLL